MSVTAFAFMFMWFSFYVPLLFCGLPYLAPYLARFFFVLCFFFVRVCSANIFISYFTSLSFYSHCCTCNPSIASQQFNCFPFVLHCSAHPRPALRRLPVILVIFALRVVSKFANGATWTHSAVTMHSSARKCNNTNLCSRLPSMRCVFTGMCHSILDNFYNVECST